MQSQQDHAADNSITVNAIGPDDAGTDQNTIAADIVPAAGSESVSAAPAAQS